MIGSLEPIAVVVALIAVSLAIVDTSTHRPHVNTIRCDQCGAVREADRSVTCQACLRLIAAKD